MKNKKYSLAAYTIGIRIGVRLISFIIFLLILI